jgi:hypothetical protein
MSCTMLLVGGEAAPKPLLKTPDYRRSFVKLLPRLLRPCRVYYLREEKIEKRRKSVAGFPAALTDFLCRLFDVAEQPEYLSLLLPNLVLPMLDVRQVGAVKVGALVASFGNLVHVIAVTAEQAAAFFYGFHLHMDDPALQYHFQHEVPQVANA